MSGWRAAYIALASLLPLVACNPAPRPAATPENRPPINYFPPNPQAQYGQLQVFSTWLTTDGRTLRIRGMLRNPYPETVKGVRVIFRLLSTASTHGRELDRVQRVLDDDIPGDGQHPLSLDVQSMYAGQAGLWGFDIAAFAVQRGGKTIPAPPIWNRSQ